MQDFAVAASTLRPFGARYIESDMTAELSDDVIKQVARSDLSGGIPWLREIRTSGASVTWGCARIRQDEVGVR